MKLENLKINVLGDSITEGYEASDPDHIFWKLLAIRDKAIVRGYGISGTRIARQAVPSEDSSWDLYFGSRVKDMDPDADVILVFGGTNDYGHGDAPMGLFTDRDETTFYGACHCLFQSLLKKYPSSRIVIMTPLHRQDEHRLVNEMGIRNVGCLEDYVNAIRKTAAYYALPVLDLYASSGIQPEEPFLRERYAPDGLHPNDAGHEKLYGLIRSFLLGL